MIQYRKGDEVYNGRFIEVNDRMIITPTPEILLENGYTPVDVEPSQEELLAAAKVEKIAEIKEYDNSDAVNSFKLNSISVWINREDRIGTRRAIELDIASGKTESEIWLNGFKLVVNSQLALKLLDAVGHYAYSAYNVTQSHIFAVKNLTSINEVEKYDYTKGYPEKLDLKTA
ncbi:hypothetical protein [Segatella salivae]|uniref:hypothetical protein n=1 Tax=Segatella salivae TaxID=228604 RepID=UPI0028EFCF85|nr:hypothetical protein [Segatella salivae]